MPKPCVGGSGVFKHTKKAEHVVAEVSAIASPDLRNTHDMRVAKSRVTIGPLLCDRT